MLSVEILLALMLAVSIIVIAVLHKRVKNEVIINNVTTVTKPNSIAGRAWCFYRNRHCPTDDGVVESPAPNENGHQATAAARQLDSNNRGLTESQQAPGSVTGTQEAGSIRDGLVVHNTGADMSEEKNSGPSISFGGDNKGEFVAGSKHVGDNVEGDKKQGETNIGGDMHGDIKHTFGSSSPVEAIFNPMLEELEGKEWPEQAPEGVSDEDYADAMQEYDTPLALMSAGRAAVAAEMSESIVDAEQDTEADEGKWTKRFQAVMPLLGKASVFAAKAAIGAAMPTAGPALMAASAVIDIAADQFGGVSGV